MLIKFKIILLVTAIATLVGCNDEVLFDENVHTQFYLRNDDADMPVIVEGNTASRTFVVVLHGGPGGSSMPYYYQIPDFTDEMEDNYAMVYWEQRSSGVSMGNPDESTLNLNQFTEDLDHLLTVLEYKYGEDIDLFLMGHSFGGMLGSAFLTSTYAANHDISGWINVDGLPTFVGYNGYVKNYGLTFLEGQTSTEWDDLRTKLEDLDAENTSLEEKTLANAYGYDMEEKARDLGIANPKPIESIMPAFFFGNYNPVVALLNHEKVNEPLLLDIIDLNFTDLLAAVDVPALYMYGEFDFVVPPTLGKEAYDAHGTDDKEFHILSKGSHNILATNPNESNALMIDFIENH